MIWFNHDQVEWQASTILGARFKIQTILEILSGLEFDRAMIKVIKAGLATVIMITVGDYYSVTPGVLHISIIYSYICGSDFIKSLYFYYVLHNGNAPKAPTQKMPSAF